MLKVWLPLDGDLRNLGASNVEVINNGATINNAGKIGKCYYFDGNGHYLQLSESVGNLYSNDFSWAVWLKPTDSTRSIISSEYASTGSSNVAFELTASRGVRIYWNGSPDIYSANSTLPINTWTHVAITKTAGIIKTYLNGQLTNTYTGTLSDRPSTSKIRIGDDYRGGTSVSYMGYMNDWRLYNHCLSAAEVKEIAQGLVLHYKLDGGLFGNPNLYTGSKDFTGTWINSSRWTTATETYQGFTVKYRSSTWGGLAQNIPCTNGDIFTISFYGKVDSGGNILSIHRSSLGNVITGLTILGGNFSTNTDWVTQNEDGTQWKRYWATLQVISSDITYIQWRLENSINGKNLYICGIKLEKGTAATPWCPADSELAINRTIISDSSGYGHNGTINGTLTTSSDTVRYSSCVYMPKTTTITHQRPIYGGTDQEWTCCMWVKLDTTSQSIQQMNNFNISNSIVHAANGTPLLYLNYGANDYYNYGNLAVSAGVWTHIAFVFKNSNATKLIYINGENHTNTSGPNKTSTPVGIQDMVTVGTNLAGYISDYRIYCTPLLDNDIKLLYNVGMKVDNLGGVHTFEFEENQPNLMWRPENARAAGLGMNYNEGLGSYTQSNCQVTCDSNGYRIYRPPNLTVANNGNTMWGGLKVVNSTNGNTHIYNETTDNIFGLTKGHTYIIILTVKGKSGKTASSFGWTNQMGWGGGGLSPNPSNVIYKNIGNNFNGETECYYKFTISDDIVKTCTTTYSGFTSGNQYLSYRDFMFGFDYESTESLGTDLYISNIRLFDLTNKTSKNIQKSGIIEFTQFVEKEENIAKIRNDEELYATEFIEI